MLQVTHRPFFGRHCSNVLNNIQKHLLCTLGYEFVLDRGSLFFFLDDGPIIFSFLYSKVNLKVNKITFGISSDLFFVES